MHSAERLHIFKQEALSLPIPNSHGMDLPVFLSKKKFRSRRLVEPYQVNAAQNLLFITNVISCRCTFYRFTLTTTGRLTLCLYFFDGNVDPDRVLKQTLLHSLHLHFTAHMYSYLGEAPKNNAGGVIAPPPPPPPLLLHRPCTVPSPGVQ